MDNGENDQDYQGDSTPPADYHHQEASIDDTTDAENSLSTVISIWWSFVWRFVLLSLAAGLVVGFILGFTLALTDHVELVESVATLVNLVIAIPVSIWALGAALNKSHRSRSVIFARKTGRTSN